MAFNYLPANFQLSDDKHTHTHVGYFFGWRRTTKYFCLRKHFFYLRDNKSIFGWQAQAETRRILFLDDEEEQNIFVYGSIIIYEQHFNFEIFGWRTTNTHVGWFFGSRKMKHNKIFLVYGNIIIYEKNVNLQMTKHNHTRRTIFWMMKHRKLFTTTIHSLWSQGGEIFYANTTKPNQIQLEHLFFMRKYFENVLTKLRYIFEYQKNHKKIFFSKWYGTACVGREKIYLSEKRLETVNFYYGKSKENSDPRHNMLLYTTCDTLHTQYGCCTLVHSTLC